MEPEDILTTVEDISAFVQLKSITGKKTKDYLHYTETVKNRILTNE